MSAGAAVYTSGDLIVANPVEATTIFLFVILVSAVLEFGIDSASDVQNKYFQVMFNALNQEIMIVGVLVLSLTFAETVTEWPDRWVLLFKWSMMCLFLMAIIFVTLIMAMLLIVQTSNKMWAKFESDKMDSAEELGTKEQRYKDAFNQFQASLTAFGYDATMGIQFSAYISKLERRNVVALTDLTWVSWVCLGTLVILNALRAEATRRISEFGDENIEDEMSDGQRVFNYISFIIIIGYGTLVIFGIIYVVLNRRLSHFLQTKKKGQSEMDQPMMSAFGSHQTVTQDDLDDSKAYLFRRSTEATLEIVQVIILFLEWYLATFILSYAYQISTNLGGVIAPFMFLFALIPAIVVIAMLPWLLMVVTMLSSLGNNLDEKTVIYLVKKAGIPEEEWPEQMKKAKKKKRFSEDDVVSVASGASQTGIGSTEMGTVELGRGFMSSHQQGFRFGQAPGDPMYNPVGDRRKAQLDNY